jgi:hypothetical protein
MKKRKETTVPYIAYVGTQSHQTPTVAEISYNGINTTAV